MKALWSAVVLQAFNDIEKAPFRSRTYDEAVAFFVGTGDWIGSRRDIADAMGMTGEALESAGRKLIRLRRMAEGVEPDAEDVRTEPVRRMRVPAIPPPPVPVPVRVPRAPRPEAKWQYNPFNPLLKRAQR